MIVSHIFLTSDVTTLRVVKEPDVILSLFFILFCVFSKGNENHWTEAGRSKPLRSRKRSHSRKT